MKQQSEIHELTNAQKMQTDFRLKHNFIVGKTYATKGLYLRAGVSQGLVNSFHTANAPLLICSPLTILRKECNQLTCLTY